MTLFNTPQDANYLRDRVSEYHSMIREPRRLYQQKVMTEITGVDGLTSVAATRQFSSTGSDFTDVLPGSVIRIRDEENIGDNGDFEVASVVDINTLLITADWPYGENDDLTFTVFYHDTYGETRVEDASFVPTVPIPFLIIQNPSEKVLTKYGVTRDCDAVILFPAQMLDDEGVTPKQGDRFIDDTGREHEITDVWPADRFSGSGIALRWVGGSKVTEKRKIIP